jgi:hypothetical protein
VIINLLHDDGDPLVDISLVGGRGEHLTHVMKDAVFYKRLPAS